jgi:glycosyltransferase involved in cell wall biosynthesis
VKIALIQDELVTSGGSERVFLYMAQEFPEADLFTLCYNRSTTWPEFSGLEITTSLLDRFISTHRRFSSLFPIGTKVMQRWDFRDYDLILTSSATTAKYIRRFDAPHICYCYYPTRAIWEYERYFGEAPGLQARIFKQLLPYFKRQDRQAAERVSHFVAISESSREAIRKYYQRDAEVLYSPIDFDRFSVGTRYENGPRFLLVSRLERWKLIDYAIEAFNALGLPLDIVGTGSDGTRLRKLAGDTIAFRGSLDDDALIRAYGEARAVISTPEIEYGLVPLEANAAGTPVIALGRGGVLETMVGTDDPAGRPATAVLYSDPSAKALYDAVRQFEGMEFLPSNLQDRASEFAIPAFRTGLRSIVERVTAELTLPPPKLR